MDKGLDFVCNFGEPSLDSGEECAEMSVAFFAPMKQDMQDA